MNDLMRRLLWLPDQASTLRAKVDTAALLRHHGDDARSIADRAAGVLFFFKYRERRRSSRRRWSSPA
jgi:hypothetical protein